MDDFQTLLYIVIGLIYFISRAFSKKKKKKPQSSRPSAPEEVETETGNRPLTFEELLQEFTSGKPVEREVEVEEVPEEADKRRRPFYESDEADDDEILEPAQRRFADDESRKIYEDSIRGASKFQKAGEMSDKTTATYGFKEYDVQEEENTTAVEVKKMLQDSEGARTAVILSEILHRKY